MNEFTTIDNIKKAFSLLLDSYYSLNFDETQNTFYLINNITMQPVLNFDYDINSRKFSYYRLTVPKCDDIFEKFENIFTQFSDFKTCQMISDALFNHDLAKIVFKDPIVINSNVFIRSKTVSKRITLSPNFYYNDAWNMLFLEVGYIITEDFKIKPIIDLCINLRGFGKTRFLVDENSGKFVNMLDIMQYRLNTEHTGYRKTVTIYTTSLDVEKHRKINDNPRLVSLNDYINDFMINLSPELYSFYINYFKMSEIISESSGSINDFKVLEMLKV